MQTKGYLAQPIRESQKQKTPAPPVDRPCALRIWALGLNRQIKEWVVLFAASKHSPKFGLNPARAWNCFVTEMVFVIYLANA